MVLALHAGSFCGASRPGEALEPVRCFQAVLRDGKPSFCCRRTRCLEPLHTPFPSALSFGLRPSACNGRCPPGHAREEKKHWLKLRPAAYNGRFPPGQALEIKTCSVARRHGPPCAVNSCSQLLCSDRHKNLLPNVISNSSAISACGKGGQSQLALRLPLWMRHHHLLPDVISYNSAISACEKGGQWQRALGLLLKM